MGWDATGDDGRHCSNNSSSKRKWLYDDDDCESKKKWMDDDEDDADCQSEQSGDPSPPDGGWGWLVVLASFVCHFILDSICFSFGADKYEYMREFNASHAKVSWIGSVLSGSYLLVGPFVSVMCAHYGCRKVTMMGSVVAMLGFALSTQATSVEMLIFFYGIIGGIGFGMIYLPAIVSVGLWFDKKRAFATGISVAGSGVGQAFFQPLASYLLTKYNWQGKNLIMAGIVFNCAVCGAIFRPLGRWYEQRRKPFNSRVEIERGVIMKALIEHKEKQRTISNGSLDDCVITQANQLIKLDPAILECKQNNSVLARFKRSLGFSAQTLSLSKSSFADIHNFFMGAINSKSNNNSCSASTVVQSRSQVSQGSSTPDVYICAPQVGGNGNNVSKPNGGGMTCTDHPYPPGFPKTRSCDGLARYAQLAEENSAKGGGGINGATSLMNLPSTAIPAPPSMSNTNMISIQVVPNSVRTSRTSLRQRSSRSVCSEYTPSTVASSHPTFVSASVTSMPQIQSVRDLSQRDSIGWKFWRIVREMFDINLMCNKMFFLLVCSSLLTLLAFYVPFFFLPDQGMKIGLSDNASRLLLSIMGISNTIGRLIGGWLADRPFINSLYLNNVSLILVGFSIIACPWCLTEATLALMAGFCAFFYGIFIALRSILLVDLLGLDQLTKSFGMLILFQGISAMVGPPLAGRLLDMTGNLDLCFFMAGGVTIVSGLLFFPIQCLRPKPEQRSEASGSCDDKSVSDTYSLDKMSCHA